MRSLPAFLWKREGILLVPLWISGGTYLGVVCWAVYAGEVVCLCCLCWLLFVVCCVSGNWGFPWRDGRNDVQFLPSCLMGPVQKSIRSVRDFFFNLGSNSSVTFSIFINGTLFFPCMFH